jgi:hypothetical protein
VSEESAPKTEHTPPSERAKEFRDELLASKQRVYGNAEAIPMSTPLIDEAARLFDEMARESGSVEGLVTALRAAESILWMAERYADAGGTHGIEMSEYEPAAALIRAALARVPAP